MAACSSSADIAAALDGTTPSLYFPDSAALRAAGAHNWHFCPDDVQSLLLQRISPDTGAATQSSPSNGSSSAQYVSKSPGALERPKCKDMCTHAMLHSQC